MKTTTLKTIAELDAELVERFGKLIMEMSIRCEEAVEGGELILTPEVSGAMDDIHDQADRLIDGFRDATGRDPDGSW